MMTSSPSSLVGRITLRPNLEQAKSGRPNSNISVLLSRLSWQVRLDQFWLVRLGGSFHSGPSDSDHGLGLSNPWCPMHLGWATYGSKHPNTTLNFQNWSGPISDPNHEIRDINGSPKNLTNGSDPITPKKPAMGQSDPIIQFDARDLRQPIWDR